MIRAVLERFREGLLDNPVFGWKLDAEFNARRFGLMFFIVQALLLATYAIAGVFTWKTRWMLGEPLSGSFFAFWHFAALYGALSLCLPLTVANAAVIVLARSGRLLDHVVVTGISPARVLLGAGCDALVNALLLLAGSLPYAIFLYIFFGVDASSLVSGYAVLLVYSPVMVAVLLALFNLVAGAAGPAGMFASLVAGTLGLPPVFGREVLPLPSHLAEITPVRFLWRLFRPYALEPAFYNFSPVEVLVFEDPSVFSFRIPLNLYTFLLWGLAFAWACLSILLGPRLRLGPGQNTFGAAASTIIPWMQPGTLPGLTKKTFRIGSQWWVDLAFWYENRPHWCKQWEFAIRQAAGIGWVLAAWGVVLGLVYFGTPFPLSIYVHDDWPLYSSLLLNVLVLFFWVIRQNLGSHAGAASGSAGRRGIPEELVSAAVFLILLGSLVAVHSIYFEKLEKNFFGCLQAGAAGYLQANPLKGFREFLNLAMQVASQKGSLDGLREEFGNYQRDWQILLASCSLYIANIFLWIHLPSRLSLAMLRRWVNRPYLRISIAIFFRLISLVFYSFLALGIFRLIGMLSNRQLPSFDGFGILDLFVPPPPGFLSSWLTRPERKEFLVFWFALHGTIALVGLLSFALSSLRPRFKNRAAGTAGGASAAVFLLASLACGSAAGQDGLAADAGIPLIIERSARCFDGASFKPGLEFATAIISNRGGEDLRGEWWLSDDDGTPWGKAAFEIGRNSRRILRIDLSGQDAGAAGFSIHSGPVRLVLECRGRRIVSAELALQLLPGRRTVLEPKAGEDGERTVLLAGSPMDVPEGWLEAASGLKVKLLHVCDPLCLPENLLAYQGARAVILGPETLASITPEQNRALFDYLRLGGTVITMGPLDRVRAGCSEPWSSLLEPEPRHVPGIGGAAQGFETLDEELPRTRFEAPASEMVRPFFGVRAVGAGRLGRLAFETASRRVPDGAGGSIAWERFESALPSSSFPLLAFGKVSGFPYFSTFDEFYRMTGFLFLSLLLLGPGFILCFRGRTPLRRLVLASLAAIAIDILILLGIGRLPGSRPDLAAWSQVTFFGPGSTHGLALGRLEICSEGHRRYELEAHGSETRFFREKNLQPESFQWFLKNRVASFLAPLPAAVAGGRGEIGSTGAAIAFESNPWSFQSISIAAGARRGAPAEAMAVLGKASGRLEYRFRPPARVDGGKAWVITWGYPSSGEFVEWDKEPVLGEDGVFHGAIDLGSEVFEAVRTISGESRRRFSFQKILTDRSYTLLADLPLSFRIWIAWQPAEKETGGLTIDCPGIEMEREVPENFLTELKRRKIPVIEREGKKLAQLEGRIILDELPVEVR